jgi:glutathione S-transferase
MLSHHGVLLISFGLHAVVCVSHTQGCECTCMPMQPPVAGPDAENRQAFATSLCCCFLAQELQSALTQQVEELEQQMQRVQAEGQKQAQAQAELRAQLAASEQAKGKDGSARVPPAFVTELCIPNMYIAISDRNEQ